MPEDVKLREKFIELGTLNDTIEHEHNPLNQTKHAKSALRLVFEILLALYQKQRALEAKLS